MPKPGSTRTTGGKVASFSSHLTSLEQAILKACNFIRMNQNNLSYLVKSDATLPPLALALPAQTLK